LRHADRGIAVDNAIPELKSVADEVIGLCDDDAVIEYLMACLPG
jgi:hydroxymethylpyrimidine pyrophosphatase-like HAD family hydrolase